MKIITRLSSIAILSFSSIAPCLSVNQALGRSSDQALLSQSQALPSAAKTTLVAFGLGDVMRTVEKGFNIREQERRREEDRKKREQLEKERQERFEAAKKRQEEFQEARRKATEQQRLEADRRQKYFESLSPEQQKAYVAEQRARQKQANEVAAGLFLMVFQAVTTPQVCRSGSWLTGYTYYEC